MQQVRYDTVITLGFDLAPSGALTPTLERRVERAIHHLRIGNTMVLVMSGGQSPSEPCSSAEAMRKYAIERGVPPASVIEQRDALDTVGEAIFTRLLLPPPLPGRRVLLVTSDFHAGRSLAIFRYVFGPRFEIEIDRVPNGASGETRSEAQEAESLQRFHTLFAGIEQGDLSNIVERLWTRHVLYQGAHFGELRRRTAAAIRAVTR
ncbi:MAG: YdcF family protein [Microvirga sp.]